MRIYIAAIGAAFSALAMAGDVVAQSPSGRDSIHFDVYRNGNDFGEHVLRFDREGEELRVEVDIDFRAGLGPITLFRYSHDATEIWRQGELVRLEAETLDDGERLRIEAERNGDAYLVNRSDLDNAVRLPASLPPSSHWRGYSEGRLEMLSTESGEPLAVDITYLGREEIEADGGVIEADRYRVVGTLTMDIWYDQNGDWAKCYFEIRGQRIEYVRRAA